MDRSNVSFPLLSLQAIQHICTHPDEVCPAGWKPGERTMHPDPLGAKEYFRASA